MLMCLSNTTAQLAHDSITLTPFAPAYDFLPAARTSRDDSGVT